MELAVLNMVKELSFKLTVCSSGGKVNCLFPMIQGGSPALLHIYIHVILFQL